MEAQISRTYAAYAAREDITIEMKKANITIDNHSQSTRIDGPSQYAARHHEKSTRHAPLDMAGPDSPILVQSVSSGYPRRYAEDGFGQPASERKGNEIADQTIKDYLKQPATPMIL